ncbi:MAG: condensation domain-containing protein [Candidatus Acidiferrales bacterium]
MSVVTHVCDAERRRLELYLRENQPHTSSAADAAIIRRSSTGPAFLSFPQEQIFLRAQQNPDEPAFYNECITVHRKGLLDVPAIERSLLEIIRRHEIWRTTYDTVDGRPVQIIHPAPSHFSLPVIDLRELPESEREAEVVHCVAELTECPFDLRQGPLLRFLLIRTEESAYRLFLIAHQSVVDGVSVYQVFPTELAIGAGFFYRPLSDHLGIEQPMLGVQLDQSVVDQLHVPYAVEELAGYMVQAIREQQPQGPYFLGGFCENGTLACETARQLLKQGHMAIFDAPNPAYFRHNLNEHPSGVPWKHVRFHLQKLRQLKVADACPYIAELLKELWRKVRRNASEFFTEIRARKSDDQLTSLERIFLLAQKKYDPKPYPGRVALFRSDTKSDEALSGWRDVITGPVEVHDSPGAHMGMFFDPHVKHLAGQLAACIERANEATRRNR